jgi:hypothetical protein
MKPKIKKIIIYCLATSLLMSNVVYADTIDDTNIIDDLDKIDEIDNINIISDSNEIFENDDNEQIEFENEQINDNDESQIDIYDSLPIENDEQPINVNDSNNKDEEKINEDNTIEDNTIEENTTKEDIVEEEIINEEAIDDETLDEELVEEESLIMLTSLENEDDINQIIISDNDTYTFSGNINPIFVESGCTPTIILTNVTIEAKESPAIWINTNSTLYLQLEGDNILKGGVGYAGICVEPSYNSSWDYIKNDSAILEISGTGNLTTTGGNGGQGTSIDDISGGGAGIGGNGQNYDSKQSGVDFGTITITKNFTGTIVANGGTCSNVIGLPSSDYPDNNSTGEGFGGGAGIGSGGFSTTYFDWWKIYGQINIENGTIIANKNVYNTNVGAGIGAGESHPNVADWTDESYIIINISNGDITAYGGKYGAGIGAGGNCDSGIINISGGKINAIAGNKGAGIGGGDNGTSNEINITGGEIIATGSQGAAGIGGGHWTSFGFTGNDTNGTRDNVGIINISGDTTVVTAYGGTIKGTTDIHGGAGIGSGTPVTNNNRSVAFDISITNGATVNAYGGFNAQAIGYGIYTYNTNSYYTGYGIKLTLDDTISLLAINSDYNQSALVATTKYDDNPITYISKSKYLVKCDNEDNENIAIGYLNINDDETKQLFDYNYSNKILYIGEYNIENIESLDGSWATLSPKVTSLSAEYVGPDILVDNEANPNDFIVNLIYSDNTTKTISLNDCVITNPKGDTSLVVPNVKYNTFTITYGDLSGEVDNVWGYTFDKVTAEYVGDKILVGTDYDVNDVIVKHIYTPYHDSTIREDIITENLTFDSTLVTQEGDNTYTVTTDKGNANFVVPGYKKEISLSVVYNGPDIYVGEEANSDDFVVIITYNDNTTKTISLSDCVVTNPNNDNSLVVPNIEYNTFTITYDDLSEEVDNVWGYTFDKVTAEYVGDKILVETDYDVNDVIVKHIYTPYHDGTIKEDVITENLTFDSTLVTQEGDNTYTVTTDKGSANFIVPGYKEEVTKPFDNNPTNPTNPSNPDDKDKEDKDDIDNSNPNDNKDNTDTKDDNEDKKDNLDDSKNNDDKHDDLDNSNNQNNNNDNKDTTTNKDTKDKTSVDKPTTNTQTTNKQVSEDTSPKTSDNSHIELYLLLALLSLTTIIISLKKLFKK